MSMTTINEITALEILDSRGNPTVLASVKLSSGVKASAMVPSGASTGSNEALELRDHDLRRYQGKGVLTAVKNINEKIAVALKGMKACSQKEIDEALISLDGTVNKAKLGANALLAVSLAFAKALAKDKKIPLYEHLHEGSIYYLPVPMMNIINGGSHADNNLDIQEFMIIPAGITTFNDAIRAGVEIFHSLKSLLKQKNLGTNVGDEGGFAPDFKNHAQAIESILEAIEKAGYLHGKEIFLGLDIASNEIYRDGLYYLKAENKKMTSIDFIAYLEKFVAAYPIISIEDALSENDLSGWQLLTKALGEKIQLVGDDLFVTNTKFLQRGITNSMANAILIKPNQIGTLSETLDAIKMAKKANYNTIISHRSGETEDTSIADLAVGFSTCQIKTGSLCRSDRIAKYNRLLCIAAELKNQGIYAGLMPFS